MNMNRETSNMLNEFLIICIKKKEFRELANLSQQFKIMRIILIHIFCDKIAIIYNSVHTFVKEK